MAIYQAIAGDLRSAIERGDYINGERLPSVRGFSRLRGVSITTILEAYRLLEQEGLITAQARKGYFVKGNTPSRWRDSMPLGCPAVGTFKDTMPDLLGRSANGDRLNLALMQPEPDVAPVDDLRAMSRAFLRRHVGDAYRYSSPNGSPMLRREIATEMLESGASVSADEIIITNGCQEALWIAALAVMKFGKVIAVQSPCYPGFLHAAQVLGGKVLEIPSDAQDGVNLDRLEEALRTYTPSAFYLMSGVANPSGVSTSREACMRIAELARRHDCFVIEDLTSSNLLYEEREKATVKQFDADNRVIVCASVSKSVAAGLRVGWIAAGGLGDTMRDLHYCTSLNTDNASQYLTWSFMKSGRMARHVAAATAIHRQTVLHMIRYLRDRLGIRAELFLPAGGFCIWLRAAGYDLAGHAATLAAKNGVSIAPGSIFTASGKYRDCLRVGWGGRWSDKVAQSLDIVAGSIDATIQERRMLGRRPKG